VVESGASLLGTRFSLSSAGYVADELVLEGRARRYTPVSTPEDGHWLVEPGHEASYRTRLVVFRPIDVPMARSSWSGSTSAGASRSAR
jgi:hypothetical protein